MSVVLDPRSVQSNTIGTSALAPAGSAGAAVSAPAVGLTGRVLLAADASSMQDVRDLVVHLSTLQSRTTRTRGQVFIEVASTDDIECLDTPELMTVTWLARDCRTGAPGTSEACRPGVALDRAVRAWVSEMSTGDPELDGGEITAVVFGFDDAPAGSVLSDLRLDLISHLGVATPA
ncbi:SIP domain-containing protein [Subtercola sp. YIM 133946]|uniref:SIP domain-containing protein n=1 Tax=Subtercola sp. YIM 133946 TaxID=3118909 RepID=UPI002F9218FB